jgi:hypothetical protein
MLALLGPRSIYRPLGSMRTRSLNTRHKRIPVYVNTWDPTTHKKLRLEEVINERKPKHEDVVEDLAGRAGQMQLRNTCQSRSPVTIRYSDLSGPDTSYTIKRLNHLIWLADSPHINDNVRRKVWRAYSLAKHSFPMLPLLMPERAWDILWAAQSIRSAENPARELHLREIYRDMSSVAKPITVGQRAEYLESLFLNGEEQLALKEWEYDHKRVDPTSRHDYTAEHLDVGTRMHALAGNADRARDIMEDLFDLYPTWPPPVMMTVFRAHTSLDSKRHHDLAMQIYVKMKAFMGKNTTLEDYDSWFVGFLEARHLQYAKKVFRNMVEEGHIACNYSREEAEKVLKRLHLLYRLGTDIEKMTSIALYVLQILPQPWHSELFGHWMQAATVQQAPEAATQVLEMMFQRGTVPQTFHFNLLLRNLLRTKDKERVLKAENIGWHMIENSRTTSVKERSEENCNELNDGIIKRITWPRTKTDMDIVSEKLQRASELTKSTDAPRKVPPADITTFALIMRHHANNLQWEHVDFLARRINELELLPNSTILNVLMENQMRQGKYSRACEIYSSFTNVPEGTPGVFPDGANLRCLWLALRLALGDHETRNDTTLPTPRQLLTETIKWWEMTRSRWDAKRFRIGLAAGDHGAVTGLMMHCFSYTYDLPGSLVALHALRKKVNIFPSDKAADILQRQVAWVDLERDSSAARAQFSGGGFKQSQEKMGRVHHILMQNRFKRMKLTGDQFAYMSKEEVGDLNLNLLSEFIRVILKRQYPPEEVEAMIDQARKEIGLPNLSTGDMDAFSVA